MSKPKSKKWEDLTPIEREMLLQSFIKRWNLFTKALNEIVRKLEQINWGELKDLHGFCQKVKGTPVKSKSDEPYARPSRAKVVVKKTYHDSLKERGLPGVKDED